MMMPACLASQGRNVIRMDPGGRKAVATMYGTSLIPGSGLHELDDLRGAKQSVLVTPLSPSSNSYRSLNRAINGAIR